ncbi:MAG: hypothetical protein M3247_06245 [Thermoproteota archaeon]|nr:hypothetical protein [Thermoproteota archaeon]
MKPIPHGATFLIAISILFVSCSSNNRTHQIQTASTPDPKPTPTANPKTVTQIQTLDDFENCEFYRRYNLNRDRGWNLKNGGYNNTYEIPGQHNINVEVQTMKDEVMGFGLVFYEKDKLEDSDLNLIYSLLQSIDTKATISPSVKEYIKTNAEINVFQIRQAKPITFNKLKIYAGKVGPEQTISIEKIKP